MGEPPRAYVFDIETNKLILPDLIWCIGIICINTGTVYRCADRPGYLPLQQGIAMLQSADKLVGHNIASYDLPQLRRLHGFKVDKSRVNDTLHAARVKWSDLRDSDTAAGVLLPDLIGRHSLKAWGRRLGQPKSNFGESTDWSEFSPEMMEYCVSDCITTWTLYVHILENA